MQAADILEAKGRTVVTCEAGAPLDAVIAVLAEKNIGAVVVAEGRTPLGIVSERDIVRALAGAPTGFRGTEVGALMTRDLHTIGPGASIDELMDLMTEHRIRHVPVVEDGALVGILSIGDVVKHRIREVTGEAEALKSYISG